MKLNAIVLTIAGMLLFSPMHAQADSSKLSASVRIGLQYQDAELFGNDGFVQEVDADLALRNFGSRLIWSGEKDLDNGMQVMGYLEFGMTPDINSFNSSGINQTRHLWAGLRGSFGTVTAGAQYAAFYDLVSSHTDIANWGSCWTQFECVRRTHVLKYHGNSDALSFSASVIAVPRDVDNDIADQIEVGFNYDLGEIVVGAAIAQQADEGTSDGGLLLGFVVTGIFGGADVGLGFQRADKDFANSATGESETNFTLSAALGNVYSIFNFGDQENRSPYYATVGYTWNIGEKTLMYFEGQIVDTDTTLDTETILRATFKYDWDLIDSSSS